MTKVHKVFVSYHHDNDQQYRNQFEEMLENDIVSRSVDMGDIDPNFKPETIWQKIRDEHLRDSTVTVVLIGTQTWQRKFVDWEIGSSIRHTQYNPRSGLIGILLPTRPDYQQGTFNGRTIPPRLYDNYRCEFAHIYDWSTNPSYIQNWIDEAFKRRNQINPDNSRDLFRNNHSGSQWQ